MGFLIRKKYNFAKSYSAKSSTGSVFTYSLDRKWTFWHICLGFFFIFLNIVQNANSFPLLLQSKDFLSKPGFLCTHHVKICNVLEIKQKKEKKNKIISLKNIYILIRGDEK